jgi:hypothetical protein
LSAAAFLDLVVLLAAGYCLLATPFSKEDS